MAPHRAETRSFLRGCRGPRKDGGDGRDRGKESGDSQRISGLLSNRRAQAGNAEGRACGRKAAAGGPVNRRAPAQRPPATLPGKMDSGDGWPAPPSQEGGSRRSQRPDCCHNRSRRIAAGGRPSFCTIYCSHSTKNARSGTQYKAKQNISCSDSTTGAINVIRLFIFSRY